VTVMRRQFKDKTQVGRIIAKNDRLTLLSKNLNKEQQSDMTL